MGRYTVLRLFASLLIGMGSGLCASTWIELSTPRFEIVTDAGEVRARELVTHLEQFEGAITHSPTLLSSLGAPSGPVRVYLFRNDTEFAEFRNQSWSAGLTISGTHAPPVILVYAGPKIRETALHEYVHTLVRRGDWKLPHWFEEGLAEFYGNSESSGSDRILVGRAVPEHLAQLKSLNVTPELLSVEPKDEVTAHRFYAASWAMVNMIFMAPKYRARIPQFISARPQDSIFIEAVLHLPTYVAKPIWNRESITAPRPSRAGDQIRTIPEVQASFMLAALQLDNDAADSARKRYQKIVTAHPNDAFGAEASGLSALAAAELSTARTQFRRATELGSSNARVWFELAILDAEAGAPWNQVKPLLERAAQLDPNDFQAAYKLGVRATDDGQLTEAVDRLAAAAQAAPGKFDVWYAYGFALDKAGRPAEARLAATRALRLAKTPEWEAVAQQFLASLDQRQPPSTRRKPEVVTPSTWENPKPDAEAYGKFLEFVCEGDSPRFRVELKDKQVIELTVADPSRVNILNTPQDRPSIDLRCGPQDGRPIRLQYRKSDSTVLGVEFPQVHDLPRF